MNTCNCEGLVTQGMLLDSKCMVTRHDFQKMNNTLKMQYNEIYM